jgi:CheY-like chemotaxis protein
MIMKEADLSDTSILIVDDQSANVALLETILSGSAFTNVRTRPIPVAMLSADTSSAQVERLRAARTDDSLTEPIDVWSFSRCYRSITRC